jgi:AcrR family transcriptional regulator
MRNDGSAFFDRCRTLFSRDMAYGRRWKSTAAQALGISRATLYRYFADDDNIALDVLERLAQLEAPARPVRKDSEMLQLYATALIDIQREIDERGWLSSPYPSTVRRALDLGAARNVIDSCSKWPTDLITLARIAQMPIFEWIPDMNWDATGEFIGAKLVENGEITNECRRLAVPGGDPEREIVENAGYKMLIGLCQDRLDGEDIYRSWRRCVIENPILQNWSATLLMDPMLAGIEHIDEIVENFYDRIPEALAIDNDLPVCTITGTIMRHDGDAFHSESRDPEAIRRARVRICSKVRYRPGMLYLKRAFRTFWCLPGKTEIELERRLCNLGWTCELWPKLDRVDLTTVSANRHRRVAIDVKDYFSPHLLAARFNGFKEYKSDHDCFLVVPDYLLEIDPSFEMRFKAFRDSMAKSKVALHTVSGLIDKLEAFQ